MSIRAGVVVAILLTAIGMVLVWFFTGCGGDATVNVTVEQVVEDTLRVAR